MTNADTPRKVKLKKDLTASRKKIKKCVKRLRVKRNQCCSLKKKLYSLKTIISELEKKSLINNDVANILENSTNTMKVFVL